MDRTRKIRTIHYFSSGFTGDNLYKQVQMMWITKGFRYKGNRQGLPGIVTKHLGRIDIKNKVSVTAHDHLNRLLLSSVRLLIKLLESLEDNCEGICRFQTS